MTDHGNLPAPNTSPGIPAPSCFYKLMLSSTFPCTKLRIPETFANRYRHELGPYCNLKVPTGATHEVSLVEEQGDIWFSGGWKEFVTCYSITYGSFMLFTYDGDSSFSVNLFDLTGCEISYEPLDELPVEEVESEDEDSNDLIMYSSSDAPNRSDPSEVILLDSESDDEETSTQRSDRKPSITISSDRINDSPPRAATERPIWLRRCKNEMEAIAAAGISLPANPFFVCSIKQFNLNRGLTLPVTFGSEHLVCQEGDSITLKRHGDQQRKWLCLLSRSGTRFTLGTGSINFTRDMFLKVGDVCLFELIDVESSVFSVHVVHRG